MKYLRHLIFLLIITLIGCNKYEINESYVEDKISYLASDELRGRKTFSPEIEIAADYIAKDFAAAGLQEFEGNTGFKQTFELTELSVDSKELILNGTNIQDDLIAAQVDQENLNWHNNEDVIVTYVRETDDLGEEFSRYRRNDDNLLVIIHPSHAAMFSRYARFLNRPVRKSKLGEGRSLVFVLSDIEEVKDYSLNTVTSSKKQSLTNVVGYIPGNREDEFVLFSGHYDHIGVRNRENEVDSIYNGANDDASGTVAVMALANYFASQSKPERSILFVAFTAEEMGGYGSSYFSKQLDPDKIVGMFNIEMIGKPATNGPNTAWITGWDKSDFGELLQKSAEGSVYKFYADPYPDQNLFYRSDNATLARLGVPAHSISTSPIDTDEDYHQASDEVKTLDLAHLTSTIKAIAKGAEKIISGENTPTRVDPATI